MVEMNRRVAMVAAGAGFVAAGSHAAAQSEQAGVAAAAADYLAAWQRKDLEAIARHIHPRLRFVGPMARIEGREAFLRSSERIFRVLERFELRATFVTGRQAMFAYDFICRPPVGLCRTAELVGFDGALIRSIELFYDARPFELSRVPQG